MLPDNGYALIKVKKNSEVQLKKAYSKKPVSYILKRFAKMEWESQDWEWYELLKQYFFYKGDVWWIHIHYQSRANLCIHVNQNHILDIIFRLLCNRLENELWPTN